MGGGGGGGDAAGGVEASELHGAGRGRAGGLRRASLATRVAARSIMPTERRAPGSTSSGRHTQTYDTRVQGGHSRTQTASNNLGYHVRVAVSIPGSYAGLLRPIGHLVVSLCHIFTREHSFLLKKSN